MIVYSTHKFFECREIKYCVYRLQGLTLLQPIMDGFQAAKEVLKSRQAAESRCWDALRFEEALQKVET